MKSRKISPVILLPLLFILLCIGQTALAGVTGKIAGLVKDKDTGEALPGANVIIEGTNRGAAADADGNYIMINVPPGTYNLKFQMIGYQPVLVKDVQVFTDRIRRVDCELSMTVLEGKEVVIVAGREVIEFDRTNSAAYVSQEEIESLPVSNFSEVVQLQSGVVTDAGGGMHFRGGRSREVAYMIDGISVTNSFSQGGGSNVTIENNFIKELQVITGTFNAEYGSAQSGIINVVTKVPENRFNASFDAMTGGFYSPDKPQYIGLDSFEPFNTQEYKFSVSGPLPFPKSLGKLGFYVNGRIVNDDGWLHGERRYMPEDGWEIEVYREWYQATYDPPDPLVIPLPDSMHTGDGEIVPINWSKKYSINTKLVYQPKPNLTLSYNLFTSDTESKTYSHSWRFCPDALPYRYSDNQTHMFVFTHSPTEHLYYNLRYSFQKNNYKAYTYKDVTDERYQTTAVNAWDPGAITGYDYGGIYSWDREFNDRNLHLVNGDVTWQINKIIEVKTGFEYKTHNLYYKNAPMKPIMGYEEVRYPYNRSEIRGLELPWEFFRNATLDYNYGHIKLRESSPDSTADHLFYIDYTRKPKEAAAYTQTKLSLGEIILNAGLRFDYFEPNDRWAPDYSIVFPEMVGDNRYYEPAKNKWQLSPRLGLSFPISERGAMRVSFGHFFQAPSFEKMYQNPVLENYNQFSIYGSKIGNPNLKPEKTIQYELGLQQELVDGLSMELTVFYKDFRDLLGIEILTLSNATTFYRYINKEYGNSSGITIAFNQSTMDGALSSSIDYTYMTAKGTSSSAEAQRDVAILSGSSRGAYSLATRYIKFLDWDQTHSLNASVSVRPQKDWYLSLIGQLGSGLPYSPSTLLPIEIPSGWWDNADRKPIRWNVDFKLYKSFQLAGLDFGAYFNVYNILNHLDENYVHSLTGQAGPDAYYPEIARKRYYRLQQIGEFTRDEADYNPTHYSRPRLIQIGLSINY